MSISNNTSIDHTKYHSMSGMNTRFWGPSGWRFFFTSILGGYPVKINVKNSHHLKTRYHYKKMLTSLGYTMPCIFCRESFQQFILDININKYLGGRIELMYWLYLIKNKVNEKLIKQEKKCYNKEKKRLKKMHNDGIISETEYYKLVKRFKVENSYTNPTPSFKSVLDEYERQRAVCSKTAKKCMLKK